MTDAPYASKTGRLLVIAKGSQAFEFLVAVGHKHHYTVIRHVRYFRTEDGPQWEEVPT